MTRTPPPHGTQARYVGSTNRPPCHCQTCRDGWNRAHQQRRLAHIQGQPPKTPAWPVAAHIQRLRDAGMSTPQIAAASGVSAATISNLAHAHNTTRQPLRSTAARILAVTVTNPAGTPRVPALGTRRRLQALYAHGYGTYIIAAHCELHPRGLDFILNGERDTVEISTRDAVASAYHALSRTPGTSEKARRRAGREGWAGPAYWDDDAFEDPDFEPAVNDRLGKVAEAQVVAEEIRHLARFGIPAHEIAVRVSRTEKYVREQLAGHRGPGWRQRQAA